MYKKKKLSFLAFLLAILASFSLASQSVFAISSTTSSYFSNFEADYYLEKDEEGNSIMRVVEEITAVFPNNSEEHGITRYLIYTGEEDLSDDKTLEIKATRNGKPENIAMIDDNPARYDDDVAYFEIRVGNANRTVSGEQVYRIEYTYRNVIDEFDDLQELYWNANGTGWTKTIRKLTARVHLSEDVDKAFTGDVACFVGKYGETNTDRCDISAISDGVEFKTEGAYLSARESLTFALGFDLGTFEINNDGYTLDTKQYIDHRLTVIAIAVGLVELVLVVLSLVAYNKVSEKRKYYKSYFVKPEYTPPHDLLVAEMAENYIGSANGDKKVATLMELAVNHKIEMVKTEKDGMFGKKNTVWKVRIKTDKLKKEQAIVLKILAGSDTPLHNGQEIVVKSHTATTELTELARNFTETTQKKLEAEGLLESNAEDTNVSDNKSTQKTKKKIRLSTVATVCCVVCLIATIFAIVWSFDDDNLPSYVVIPYMPILLPALILGVILATIILTILNSKTTNYDKHTMKGLEYSRYMDGLKMYIKMAEADRLKMLQSVDGADVSNEGIVKVYEKLLPYAIIFRMEKSWLAELGRYYELEDVTPPVWYVGMGVFSARDFSSAMSSISSTTSSAIISSSSTGSSGGGGFGGGGFAGGGGGGGGGGTW